MPAPRPFEARDTPARATKHQPPGLYTFPVRVTPAVREPTELALSLRVLPFRLERPERMHSMRAAGTWHANRVMMLPGQYAVEFLLRAW